MTVHNCTHSACVYTVAEALNVLTGWSARNTLRVGAAPGRLDGAMLAGAFQI